MMSNHATNTFYNIPQGHDTSLPMSWKNTLTHTNNNHMKTKTIHEDILLSMFSRMSVDEYFSITSNIIALRPINKTLIIVTNTKLLFVANTKPLIYRQQMYNLQLHMFLLSVTNAFII